MLKKIKDTSEAQLGRIAERLLSNEKFMAAVQKVVEQTLRTREQVEAMSRFALGTLNVPSRADLDRVSRKVEEIEELLDELGTKLDGLEQSLAESGERQAEG